jgi:hypothetical protein
MAGHRCLAGRSFIVRAYYPTTSYDSQLGPPAGDSAFVVNATIPLRCAAVEMSENLNQIAARRL